MPRHRSGLACRILALFWLSPLFASGQVLNLSNDIQTSATLTNTTATLTGKSELHITGTGDPIPGCIINLNSPESWFFLDNLAPSAVNTNLLGRVRVSGAAAVLNTNARVVQFGMGTVVIPHAPGYAPLEVFDGANLTGPSKSLTCYTAYNDIALGSMKMAISSFRLKRGYMATFAQQENGTGISKCYVAQDGDLEIGILPTTLNDNVRFIRVFPWRWVSKKGICGNIEQNLNVKWLYNWNLDRTSTLDWEYVPIRQLRYWPDLNQDWKYRGATHVLGYNEPDHSDQANMSVADAIASWPDLLSTGLRVGAPAVSDGGLSWLYSFIDQADAAGLRVDFVPVHYYRSYSNAGDPAGAATQFYNFLKGIHDRTQRPIWITEFNNGANWTGDADPTFAQQQATVAAMIEMLDNTPWVERYSISNWVEDVRRVVWDDGSPTDAGATYRDNASPNAYLQDIPDSGTSPAAYYLFEGDLRDTSGSGNTGVPYGTPSFVAGKQGQAVSLDGTNDYVVLPPRLGDSTDFTFSAWINWNGGANWQRVFDLGDGQDRNMFLCPKSGGNTLRFVIKTNGVEQQLNGTPLTAGVWTHVAVTISGDTGKLFVNGTLVNTNAAMTYNPVDLGTRTNYLGKSQYPDPLFSGKIDSARFFTYALTDAQVLAAASTATLQFSADPLVLTGAVPLQPFTGSLAGSTSAGNGARVFTKLGGPAWLAIAADGSLTGVPGVTDSGDNAFLVRVSDSSGLVDTATVKVQVAPAPGLVARYAFNSSTASAVGTANGTATGGPAYVAGHNNTAINFDAVDDFVTLPYGVANYPEMTFASWVLWDGGGQWQRIFDFGNGTADNLFLTPRAGGTNGLRFSITIGGVTQSVETGQLASGQWVHVAVTLGSGTARLYVNGTLAATQAISFKPSDFSPATNYLGKSQWPDPLFDGRLDEFVIFNRALDSPEVAALYTGTAPVFVSDPISKPDAPLGAAYDQSLAGAATGGTVTYSKIAGPEWLTVEPDGRISGVPAASDTGTNRFVVRATNAGLLADDAVLNIVVPTPSDLIAHYQFHGNVLDSTGSFPGITTGGPTFPDAIFDKAVDLDGTDDFVTLPGGIVSSLNDITIATRVRWDGGAIWQRIFDFGTGTTQYMCLTPNSGAGTLRFTITTNGNSAAAEQRLEAPPLPIGEWSHVAVTLIGTTGTLYVNGATVATGTITLDPSSVAPTKNYLGKSQFTGDAMFNGMIDDFRIYNRGLSASEVKSLAVPVDAVIVPGGTYEAWAAGIPFPEGQSGGDADPDGDGVNNLMEYVLGSAPLTPGAEGLPNARIRTAAELGESAVAGKTYLSFSMRVRKVRPGVTLTPEASDTIEGLALPVAASQAIQAGPPVADGDYETYTWFYPVAIEDAPTGFMRLRVTKP